MLQLQLPETLQAPCLDVMNFLNEITLQYPSAISFAPGRPAEHFFDVRGALDALGHYTRHLALQSQQDEEAVLNQLGQYQKTNGVINDLVRQLLEQDEHIFASTRAVVMTDGCQEGMMLLLTGLFQAERDVLVVIDPTYTGITGIASVLGIDMHAVPSELGHIDLDLLAAGLRDIRQRGKRPRALYVTPDFNNPLGSSLSLEERKRLLDLAYAEEMLLFEDNTYGMFAYEGESLPTLKALDTRGNVIYLGTFSKVLFPGLRLGFLVADQQVVTSDGSIRLLAQELSKVKSFTTVSTSALPQAMVGGWLLQHASSLRPLVQEKVAFYRENRNEMLSSLEREFGNDPLLAGLVSWNRPGGGFFLTVNLPFAFTNQMLSICAEKYGVICCPMSFFSLLGRCENQVRLSFSYASPKEIRQGIHQFWKFVHDQVKES